MGEARRAQVLSYGPDGNATLSARSDGALCNNGNVCSAGFEYATHGLGRRAGIILPLASETRKHVLTRENTAALLLVVNGHLRLLLGLHTAWARPQSNGRTHEFFSRLNRRRITLSESMRRPAAISELSELTMKRMTVVVALIVTAAGVACGFFSWFVAAIILIPFSEPELSNRIVGGLFILLGVPTMGAGAFIAYRERGTAFWLLIAIALWGAAAVYAVIMLPSV